MRSRVTRTAAACLLLALFSAACAGATEPLNVFVSIVPQEAFVGNVGGERVDVHVLVPPGQSPATYQPTLQQMTALAEADVLFTIGVPFEKTLVPKIRRQLPDLRIVPTDRGVSKRTMVVSHHHEGDHDDDYGEAAGTPDPHIWLSPRRVKIQATTIADALIELDPGSAAAYRRNLKAFCAKLDAADARIAEALAPLRGRSFYVFHPAFGYFGDDYGLHQVAVEVEGKEPGARELAALIESARADGVRVIFVQRQFATKSARAVARAIGGAVVPLDPLASDYLANLERIADALEKGLAR